MASPAVWVRVFDLTGLEQCTAVLQVLDHDGIGLINMPPFYHGCTFDKHAGISNRIEGFKAIFHANLIIFLAVAGGGMH